MCGCLLFVAILLPALSLRRCRSSVHVQWLSRITLAMPVCGLSKLPDCCVGGDEEDRTLDPLLAGQVLSQLSYTPIPNYSIFFFLSALLLPALSLRTSPKLAGCAVVIPQSSSVHHSCGNGSLPSRIASLRTGQSYRIAVVGPSGLEPPTSCLSGTRSNHLSYEPIVLFTFLKDIVAPQKLNNEKR